MVPRVAICMLALVGAAACNPSRRGLSKKAADLGPSQLTKLGLNVDETRLGHAGGSGEILVRPVREPALSRIDSEPFVFTGADIYRLTCRPCHGPQGHGAPPEIGTLITPIEATSKGILRERMKRVGREVSEALLADVAADAERSVRTRIASGGEKMPAFDYLTAREREALWEYLLVLADAPEQEGLETRLELSAGRIGELLIRGTCHLCHDARGPGGHHAMMMRGITPSLESLTTRPFHYFLDKTREGAGMGPMPRRARMPIFAYLTTAELAAAYRFLVP